MFLNLLSWLKLMRPARFSFCDKEGLTKIAADYGDLAARIRRESYESRSKAITAWREWHIENGDLGEFVVRGEESETK